MFIWKNIHQQSRVKEWIIFGLLRCTIGRGGGTTTMCPSIKYEIIRVIINFWKATVSLFRRDPMDKDFDNHTCRFSKIKVSGGRKPRSRENSKLVKGQKIGLTHPPNSTTFFWNLKIQKSINQPIHRFFGSNFFCFSRFFLLSASWWTMIGCWWSAAGGGSFVPSARRRWVVMAAGGFAVVMGRRRVLVAGGSRRLSASLRRLKKLRKN